MAAEPTVQELRALVAEFQPGKGHVMPALHRVQETYGYIPREAIEAIARQLNTTAALIYGAASFYADFRPHQPAATEVAGAVARPAGSSAVTASGKPSSTRTPHRVPEQTDHPVGLHMGQCIGTCHEAPQVWVNGNVVGNLTAGRHRTRAQHQRATLNDQAPDHHLRRESDVGGGTGIRPRPHQRLPRHVVDRARC
ncbi:MAG: NAD(P)H-dependent oxidoreductase subunit E [Dehalococcoidia bacterium]|nr:NAD(P)H-dependent oxidoreductase subunit E [Dehalococcoidia bacterium]